MSRFANPDARDRLVLGPCECPGTPHAEDYLELRTELGAEDAIVMETGAIFDKLTVLIVGWNLLDNDGEPAPVDRGHIAGLFADNFAPLDGWIDKHLRMGTVPNRSAARSPLTSVASGSHRTGRRTKAA
jgi:hypothetical protein